MTHRERMLRTLSFQSVDRVPLVEWEVRGATLREWYRQGLPEGVIPQDYFGLDPFNQGVPMHFRMEPFFTPVTLEENDRYRIWQDELGAVRKDFVRDENPGFVTRSWLSFPVTDRDSFREMKKRYRSDDPARVCPDPAKAALEISRRDAATHLSIHFLFWQLRDWVGFENLCMMFYDDPALVHEMMEFLTDFIIDTLRRHMGHFQVDIVEFKEDMAYKGAPMISPQMFRTFMRPHYIRLIEFLRSHGVKFVYVDCDGYPGGLIPEYMETGVDGMSPVEIAAGNDLIKLRKEYPAFAMLGGIDKRELARDRKAIYNEVMGKVPWLLERGGYVPHVDHAIPHNVPFENYVYYRRILTQAVCGQNVEAP